MNDPVVFTFAVTQSGLDTAGVFFLILFGAITVTVLVDRWTKARS